MVPGKAPAAEKNGLFMWDPSQQCTECPPGSP